jgi:sugar lactone lactonase YvrE
MKPTLLSFLVIVCVHFGLASSAQGQVYPIGVQSTITPTAGNWGGPVGVATDSNGNIYIAEHSADEIVELNAVTHASSVLLTTANGTALNHPQGLWIDASSNLYIADSDNDWIVVYSIPSATVTATYATADYPFAVTADASGDIWVAGNSTNTAGYGYLQEIPSGSSSLSTIITTESGLDEPRGILFDSAGNFYVSDYGNNAVYKYASRYTTQTTLISGITTPAGMIFDAQGNLDITSGTVVTRYLAPDYSTSIPLAIGLVISEGIAADAQGDLFLTNYVSGAGSLYEISPAASFGSQNLTTTSSTVSYNFAVVSGTTINTFNFLDRGVTSDQEFTNTGTNCIMGSAYEATTSCSVEATFTPVYPGERFGAIQAMGSGTTVLGTAFLNGIGVGPQVALTPGTITTVAGNGTAGYLGDGVAATSTELNAPKGVAVDGSGNLYIADMTNNRIREVAAGTGIITTVAGSANYGTSGDGDAATSAELWGPTGVALDSLGNLYIADYGNSRIQEVEVTTPPTLTLATSTDVGMTDSTDGPQAFTVSNIGNAGLTIEVPESGSNPSVPVGFTLESTGSPCAQGTLLSGTNCTLAVEFTPTVAGLNSGSVALTDNNLDAPSPYATQSILVSGTGIALPTATVLVSSMVLTQNHATTPVMPVIGSGGTVQ